MEGPRNDKESLAPPAVPLGKTREEVLRNVSGRRSERVLDVDAAVVPRAEARERGEHLVLKAAPAFEVRFCGPGFDQELTDHRADRRVLLGRPDARTAIDVFGK